MSLFSRQLLAIDLIVLALLGTGIAVGGVVSSGPEWRPFWLLVGFVAVFVGACMLLLTRSQHFAPAATGGRWPWWRVATYSVVTFTVLGFLSRAIDRSGQANWMAGATFLVLYLASRYLLIRRYSGTLKNGPDEAMSY